MWRRVVAGVVVASAVVALALAASEPDPQTAGIVVPQSETGELSMPQSPVRAVAADPTVTSITSVAPTVASPTVTTTRSTTRPTTKSTRTTTTTTTTTTAPRFDPSATFRIVNYVNSLVLDSGGNVEPGTAMKLWEPLSPSTNLRFQLVETGGGYYRLVNRTNGLTVDGRGATTAGAYVGQRSWDSSAAMQWLPTDTGNGLFTFTNRATGLVLDGGGPYVEYGAKAKQWPAGGSPNLLWRIETVKW